MPGIESLPQDVLNHVFSFLKEDEQDNIKMVNKAFYKAYSHLRNPKYLEACKKFFGFAPPLEKAFLIFKICTFIESKGASHQSKDKKALINSANEILKSYRNLNEAWAFYYSSLLYLNFGASEMAELAAKYCLTSAGFEFPPALCLLGMFYQEGTAGFPKNKDLMLKYFMLASDKGNIGAKRKLGIFYINQNNDKGLKFLEEAAEANDTQSLIFLGNLHKDDKLIKSSADLAIDYFDKAIALGSSKAAEILMDAFGSYWRGDCIIPRDAEKAKAYRIKYYELEIKVKNGLAARKLGLLYIEDKQETKGLHCLKLAMEFKDGIGSLELARFYREKDEDKAKIIPCYAAAYEFLKKEKRSVAVDDALSSCKTDGIWLISQGELKLGANFATETSSYSSPSSSSDFTYLPI